MKKSKIIVPALGILVLSTAAAVTGTVAWFTSSNLLSVSGMQAKVDAENGVVISNEKKSDWKESTVASHSGLDADNNPISFGLTSTANLQSWYHANSDDANESAHAGAYETLTFDKPAVGEGETGVAVATLENETNMNVYLLNRFYIQSASGRALTGQDIFVRDLKVTGMSASQDLDKAIRIAFKAKDSNDFFIYGGVADFTKTYNVNGSTTATTALDPTVQSKLLSNIEIPAYVKNGSTALEIETYVYFEGEDAEARSINIKETLDDLSITFKFENKIHA